jgi:hypothetical protein
MSPEEIISFITGGSQDIPADWMPAASIRPFVFDDPALIWLAFHGAIHGFKPDSSPYGFLDYVGKKGREFEAKWISVMAKGALTVCSEDYEVRSLAKVVETIQHICAGVPAIAKPALWLGHERIYGVPDLIVHTSWLKETFPGLFPMFENESPAPNLGQKSVPGHYVVFDLKFTTGLDKADKKRDLLNYAAQVRIYSYILGTIQGLMPKHAYLSTRDRIDNPLPIKILSEYGKPLDQDLTNLRDSFVNIKVNGAKFNPWTDEIVASNFANRDDKWATAKFTIANDKYPGRDPVLLHQVSANVRQELRALGFSSLEALMVVDSASIPFEECKGLGASRSKVLRAILDANRTRKPIKPDGSLTPVPRQYEFFVDYEYLVNINVDFEKQWPTLDGHEMVFMIGVANGSNGHDFHFMPFIANAETAPDEEGMFSAFIEYLDQQTHGNATNPNETVLFHWTDAEVWQSKRSADRLNFALDHPLRCLPWFDLQEPFTKSPGALPDAWGYGLKEIASALGTIDPTLSVHWPVGLGEGLEAMVMGWHAYASKDPLISQEMSVLKEYLEIDCAALSAVLQFLRS